MRNTKIIITIGPSCFSEEILTNLIELGVNCIRINFSHTKAKDIKPLIKKIRNLSESLKKPVAILGDISGPKLRVDGVPSEGITLKKNTILQISREKSGDLPFFTLPQIFDYIDINERIFFDDRKIEGYVLKKRKDIISIKIKNASLLLPRKGVNLPDSKIGLSVITKKDLKDIKEAISGEVDFLALSFVRNAADVKGLQKLIHKQGKFIPIISKIERKEAVKNIEEIIDVSDGIMVARGDLGVEIDLEKVPVVQKDIIERTNLKGKLVIVATQIMESMVQNPSPTRAEVSDIAYSIYDGVDALMLSGETSVGKYPLGAVKWLSKVAESTELEIKKRYKPNPKVKVENRIFFSANAIAHSAYYTSLDTKASAIICITSSGATSLLISKYHPGVPIIALSNKIKTIQRVSLFRGVSGFYFDLKKDLKDYNKVMKFIVEKFKFKHQDTIIMTQGFPPGISGTTNSIMVFKIGQTYKRRVRKVSEYYSGDTVIRLDRGKCITCGVCEECCPVDVFDVELRYIKVNKKNIENCLHDLICVKKCPVNAIEIKKIKKGKI
ncbi:pyruvate kinase [Candidatus Dependentiae bacterium]|nr:pyruvate kinase [Candidatus Dependentiae bacterium]